MKNVDGPAVALVDGADDEIVAGLPDEVQLALVGIAEAAREGLLALSVTAGLAVLGELMELDRVALCGPRDAKDPNREFLRNGTEGSHRSCRRRRLRQRRLRGLVRGEPI